MTVEWLALAPPGFVVALVALLPGWTILTLLGRRGLGSLSAAPAVSIGVVTLAALVTEATGWAWGWLPVLATTLAVAALAHVVRRRSGQALRHLEGVTGPWGRRAAWVVAALLLGSLLLWLRHLTNVLPDPTSFSQTYDNVFHLNTIRFVADSGDAGPWLPRNLDPDLGRTIFYPTAWHQLGALAMPATGNSVALSSNAVLFVTCALVWPLSALELGLALGIRTAGGLLSVGVLAGSFSSYPFLMLDWGVLYPNLLAYALVPGALSLVAAFLLRGPAPGEPLVGQGLAAALAGLGVTVAHPNGLLLLLALALPALIAGVWAGVRLGRQGESRWWQVAVWCLLAAGALAAFARLWLFARPSNRPWPPLHDVPTALEQAVSGHPILGPPGPIPALLAAIGFALLILRGRHLWYVGAGVVGLSLWVVGSGFADGTVRELLTGAWYSDSYRLGPILGLVSVPAAAYAIDQALLRVFPDQPPRRAEADDAAVRLRRRTMAAGLLAPALLLVSTQWSPSIHHAVTHARTAYDLADVECTEGDVTCLLTADELRLLDSVAALTPEDALLLADPETGASLAYAFSGRRVIRPYIGATTIPAEQVLLGHLREGGDHPSVCPALAETGVTHVLDFGRQNVHSRWLESPGLDHLDESPGVRLLRREGAAALYEVVACR